MSSNTPEPAEPDNTPTGTPGRNKREASSEKPRKRNLIQSVLRAKLGRLSSRRALDLKGIDLILLSRLFIYKIYANPRVRETGKVSIKEIIQTTESSTTFFVMLIFALPLVLPVPYIPGFSSIMSVPLFVVSTSMILNKKDLILPKFIKNYEFKASIVKWIIAKSTPTLKYINKISKKRLSALTKKSIIPIYGVFATVFNAFIFLPLPGSNFIPSIGLVLISIGFIAQDGLFCIMGVLVGILGITTVLLIAKLTLAAIKAGASAINRHALLFDAIQFIVISLIVGIAIHITLRAKRQKS